MVRAVVDVGSNSVLLAVGRCSAGAWVWSYGSSRVTALGEGTKTSGLLSPKGVVATLETLRRFWAEAKAQGAETVWAAATMAVRIARDQKAFLEAASQQGTPVFVLSGDDEARLGFLSVAEDPLFAGSGALSIIDPGGHSTEIVVAKRVADSWETKFRQSFPFGALALREDYMTDASPDQRQRLAALAFLDEALSAADLPAEAGTVVTLGATGTNLVSVRDRLVPWQPDKVHGASLLYEEVGRSVGWLCDMDDKGRAALAGMETGRERTIHCGALILERAMHALHSMECRVSVHGWRHALAAHPEFVPQAYPDGPA